MSLYVRSYSCHTARDRCYSCPGEARPGRPSSGLTPRLGRTTRTHRPDHATMPWAMKACATAKTALEILLYGVVYQDLLQGQERLVTNSSALCAR